MQTCEHLESLHLTSDLKVMAANVLAGSYSAWKSTGTPYRFNSTLYRTMTGCWTSRRDARH